MQPSHPTPRARTALIIPRLALLLPILLAAQPARAEDAFYLDKLKYPATISGFRDGRLAAVVGGSEKLYDLEKIQIITLAAFPRFNDAETARGNGDSKAAAALYKDVIRSINNRELKLLAEYRAIRSADADGKWSDAVSYFLDVYQAAPTDSVWNTRPTHFPPASSSLLKESADRVAAAARTARSDDVRKNLKNFQLDILLHSGDTDAAQRLAKEIATGISDDTPKPRPPDALSTASATLEDVSDLIRAKDFTGAIRKIDTLLEISSPELCVQLFALKARAYEQQNQLDLAAAALLRIPAHYPSSPAVPAALLQAAELEKRARHPEAAKALYQEILDRHPDSKEALAAKAQ